MPGKIGSPAVPAGADGCRIPLRAGTTAGVPAPGDDPAEDVPGPDVGVGRFAADSGGEFLGPPDALKKTLRRLRHLVGALPRKREASRAKAAREHKGKGGRGKPRVIYGKNCGKNRRAIARPRKRIADMGGDFLHRASTATGKSRAHVAAGDPRILDMAASASGAPEDPGRNVRARSGLNRAVLDRGRGVFPAFPKYKPEAGGRDADPCPAAVRQPEVPRPRARPQR
jgi:putative transposase